MSVHHYHHLCNRYKGRAVEIKTHNGELYHGVIDHVDDHNVYLRPLGPTRNFGGFGYGFFGWGAGGLGWGIALGAIATLALLPFFWW